MLMTDLQVHQFQPHDDPAVIDSEQVCQGPGRLCCHVLYLLLGFRSAWLPALWQPEPRVQQLLHVNVRIQQFEFAFIQQQARSP